MNRRSFVIGAAAGVLAISKGVRLAAHDPCISALRADNIPTIGDPNGSGGLTNIMTNVGVCEMNLEQDDKVLFHFRVTNTRANNIRIVHCQPWAANSWVRKERLGPFGEVNAHDFFKAGTQPGGWRANNDSNAFYAEVNINGVWQSMGQLREIRATGDARRAHMEWHSPHEVRFEVWATDTR
jgi:hypothetical protein